MYTPESVIVPSGVVAGRVCVELRRADVGVDDVTGRPLLDIHALVGVCLDPVAPDNVAVAPGLPAFPLRMVGRWFGLIVALVVVVARC